MSFKTAGQKGASKAQIHKDQSPMKNQKRCSVVGGQHPASLSSRTETGGRPVGHTPQDSPMGACRNDTNENLSTFLFFRSPLLPADTAYILPSANMPKICFSTGHTTPGHWVSTKPSPMSTMQCTDRPRRCTKHEQSAESRFAKVFAGKSHKQLMQAGPAM